MKKRGSCAANPVLIVASFEKGRGTGHLIRASMLASSLNSAGKPAFILIKGDRTLEEARAVAGDKILDFLIDENEAYKKQFAFIVCDRFKTPEDEFLKLKQLAPLIGIDEGGPMRANFDFLLDLLQLYPGKIAPNLSRLNLLTMPAARKPVHFALNSPNNAGILNGAAEKLKILISFGGEDEKKLGNFTAKTLKTLKNAEITLVQGALSTQSVVPGVKIEAPRPNLREEFRNYSILITHYGLGAFESVYAGTAVILLSPSTIHKKAAKKAGFLALDRKGLQKAVKSFDKTLSIAVKMSKNVCKKYSLSEAQTENFADFIMKMDVQGAEDFIIEEKGCAPPKPRKVIARFAEKTYKVCPVSGMIYMLRINPPPFDYGEDYFFSSYKAQYGKTYLEDFPNLRQFARRRIAIIKALLEKKAGKERDGRPRLLDIGCAYGALLLEARDAGFDPEGIDPAQSAVNYIRANFGIKAQCGFFPQDAPCVNFGDKFDVITMMYVIEHFISPYQAIKKASGLLKEGGVFAFSTPSASGVSGRFFKKKFLEQSPDDHWTIWSPRSAKKILHQFGFKVKKIVITGHHPERFPLIGAFAGKNAGFLSRSLFNILLGASKIFSLGDTFEVYAMWQPAGRRLDT